MTKSPNTEVMDSTPDTIEENANNQPRPQHGHPCIKNQASEIEDTCRAQLQTHGLNPGADQAVEIVNAVIAAPTVARALATLEHLSNKVDVLSERAADIQSKQKSNFESLDDDLRKLRAAFKKRNDSLKGRVESIENVLSCVHDEFHSAEDDGLDMNMSERLGYLVDIAENTGGVKGDVERLREGFSTWRIAERADRKAVKKGVEKVGGKMESVEERMKGIGEMLERVLGTVEKMGGKE